MLISVEALRSALTGPEPLVLIDARQGDHDPALPHQQWLEARIPGAARVDMATAIAAPRRSDGVGGRNPMPTPTAFIAGLNAAGAHEGVRLVAYDARMEGVAARVWWIARELGITIEVLEGGLAAWRAADGAIASGESDVVVEPGDLRCPDGLDADAPVGADGRNTVTAEHLLGPDPSLLLLDVRSPARYRGDEEPLDAAGGHIPGAVNVPATGSDGRGTSAAVLADLVAHEGEIVASCGSGVSACLMVLRLADAGRSDAKLYPGSWSEWLALGLPRATGDDPR